jgi:beta-lactamase superfamily II metal-dependent hydrolase
LRGEFSGTRILLLSDLGRAGQNALMRSWPIADLRADIIVVGQPSQPLAESLLLASRPKIVIVADAMYPADARASRQFQRRLAHQRLPVIYTRFSAAVTITLGSRGDWTVSTMNGSSYRSRDLPYLRDWPAGAPTEDAE